VAELAGWLLTKGAERLSVAALEQTFAARNALYESLEKRIGAGSPEPSFSRAGATEPSLAAVSIRPLSRMTTPLRFLPPCGGGLRRGVAPHSRQGPARRSLIFSVRAPPHKRGRVR